MGTAITKLVNTIEESQSSQIPPFKLAKKNPGSVQCLHTPTEEIMPYNFDGIKFILNKSLNSHFVMNHILNITNGPENGYRFGTFYTGTEEWKGIVLPIFQGEINTSGHLIATVAHQVTSMRLVAVVHYKKHLIFPELLVDWIGNNFTATISATNISTKTYPHVVECSYLMTITEQLTLGVKGCYHFIDSIGPMPVCVARYVSGPFGWSASISPRIIHLCHYININDNLRLGFIVNGRIWEKNFVGYFGYQFSCPKKEIVVRGMVDSQWNVRSTVEKRLTTLPIIFLLSASLNQRSNRFGLGCGVILNK